MIRKVAEAAVTPIRQTTQYNCMTASMSMCLKALGIPEEEASMELVNRVMGARPMAGASWEDAIASAQHYGMRVHLICPATLEQVKTWTDQGIPVMIAWNPEGRPWSHASVIFDVDQEHTVWVADPNIPDPSQTVRVVPKEEFYKKWSENRGDYLVRRTALAVMREITSEGKQVVATGPYTTRQSGIVTRVPRSIGTPSLGYYTIGIDGEEFMTSSTPRELDRGIQIVFAAGKTKDQAWGGRRWAMDIQVMRGAAQVLPVGTPVRVPHKGKLVPGKVIRYDRGGPEDPFYIVDVGEYESLKVMAQNVRVAAYGGNPNGQPIYPHEVDHGYDQPLAGGSDVMKRLQNRLLQEQGQPQRPENPRLARQVALKHLAGLNWKGVAQKLLDRNKGASQSDLHYRAYLRAVVAGQPAGHLTEKFEGARAARQDLIDEVGMGKYAGSLSDSLVHRVAARHIQRPARTAAAMFFTDAGAEVLRMLGSLAKKFHVPWGKLSPAKVNAYNNEILLQYLAPGGDSADLQEVIRGWEMAGKTIEGRQPLFKSKVEEVSTGAGPAVNLTVKGPYTTFHA